jgi:hypothetical protein
MAVSGNGRPKPRFDRYVPHPGPGEGEFVANAPQSAFGPNNELELRGERQPDADLWTFDPNIKLPNDAYRGVRRASAARPHRKVGLAVGAVVLAAAAVALFIVIKPFADTGDRAGRPGSPILAPSDLGAGQPTSPQPSPGTTTGVPVSASPISLPAFAPLTFEAEAGPPTVKRRGGDVETMAGASGGTVVRFLGGSGDLEIRSVAFTDAGTYRISIYYASRAAGSAVVSLPDAAPLTVRFVGGSGCCAVGAVDVALPAGPRALTISEITSGVAIDKVVITRAQP